LIQYHLRKLSRRAGLLQSNFDGAHLVHQKIIKAPKTASEKFAASGLYPEKAPGILSIMDMKKHLLQQYGVDCLTLHKDSFELLIEDKYLKLETGIGDLLGK